MNRNTLVKKSVIYSPIIVELKKREITVQNSLSCIFCNCGDRFEDYDIR